jgi:multiple sugar transport system ATP-binding protein
VATIELENLTKRYADGTQAVRGVDLDISDGEFMILVGPSGCGKTTVLRMLAGLEDITEGTVRIGGRVVNDAPPKERDIAMIFQNYALYPHMSVRENIGFGLKLAKTPKAEVARRVGESVQILDLVSHLDRRPANLSGGQRQRVAIGRAIVRAPQAFLMDEPLSNLDAKLRVQMRVELARLQARLRTTTVYVTHDQTEAMTLGDRLAVMRGGLIQQVGSSMDLYENPANVFVAGFIGSPPTNFLPAELDDRMLRLPIGEAPLPDDVMTRLRSRPSERRIIAGVRPEAFEDGALAPDSASGELCFSPRIDVVEAMGSELLAYFSVERPASEIPALSNLDEGADASLGSRQDLISVVARLDPRSQVAAGAEANLRLHLSAISLFDGATGETLLGPKTAGVSAPRNPSPSELSPARITATVLEE